MSDTFIVLVYNHQASYYISFISEM